MDNQRSKYKSYFKQVKFQLIVSRVVKKPNKFENNFLQVVSEFKLAPCQNINTHSQ